MDTNLIIGIVAAVVIVVLLIVWGVVRGKSRKNEVVGRPAETATSPRQAGRAGEEPETVAATVDRQLPAPETEGETAFLRSEEERKPVEPTQAAPAKPASINMQINFEYNSAEIAGSSEKTMATLAKALASPQLEGRKFTVIGHTDASGSAAYNKALSDRRAAAVRRYLTENGVAASRLKATGKGESQLLNNDDPNAAENRRVEIQATGG